MKKFLLSFAAACFAFGVNAQTEVLFDFDNNATDLLGIEGRSSNDSHDGDITEDVTATVDGVSVTISGAAEGVTNANRLWYTKPTLRMYSGTLTVAAPGHFITGIVFKAGSNFNVTVNTGELDDKKWIADEGVDEVVFTVSKNTQINTITVTLDGTTSGGDEPVVIEGTGEGTAASPYDVTRALSLIANDKASTAAVYVTGEISKITEVSVDYGNATYYIAQGEKEIMVFRGYSLNGKKFLAEDEIKVGDVVVLTGVLKDYNGTPEITNSSIVLLNGEGADVPEPDPVEIVGDGTLDNPYTVADVQALYDTADCPTEKVWIKGYILGFAKSGKNLETDESKITDTNIALGATADATTFIPVALPAGDARTALGVATNPENVGKEVKIYGSIEKYFSVAGVKNVSEWEIDGMSGIEGVAAADNAPAVYYNLQGVRVAEPTNGLYIVVRGNKVAKEIVR